MAASGRGGTSGEIARTERERIEQQKVDEAIFLEAWRNWRQGRSREEAEAKAAWLFSNASGVSVDSAMFCLLSTLMSKGFGKVQRTIAALIRAEPDGAWAYEHLAERIYGTARFTRAQKNAIGRALAAHAASRDMGGVASQLSK